MKKELKSIVETHPELLEEWDYKKNKISPEEVSKGSNREVWWKCKKYGHSWPTKIHRRAILNAGCWYCSNQKVLPGFNDLKTRYPEAAKMWHQTMNELKPSEVLPGSERYYWWIDKKCGHYWDAAPMNVTKGRGCPFCAGRRILKGFNDLLSQSPENAALWDYEKNGELSPDEFTCGSHKIIWWKCKKGHEWDKSIKDQLSTRNLCAMCDSFSITFGNITITNPRLLKEWDFNKNTLTYPHSFTEKSSKQVWWKCLLKGHETRQSIRSYVKKGCKFCHNGLAEKFPHLKEEWNFKKNEEKGLFFDQLTSKSKQEASWICKLEHEWDTFIYSRTKGNGCPTCANKIILKGYNDLATLKPYLLEQWDYEKNTKDPNELSIGSNEEIWWKCRKNNHSYSCVVYAKTDDCNKCWMGMTSKAEQELANFIISILGKDLVVLNDRSLIHPRELDIYVPSLKIAFEYNGNYWHDKKAYEKDLLNNISLSREKQKTDACKKIDVELVHIWEDEWRANKEKMKQEIKRLLRN